MGELNFAIVGCGNIAPFHADAIKNIDNANVIAVCDNIKERAEALAEAYKVEAHTDYDAMLKKDDIDVVNICLPSGLHEEMSVKAAQAGKHVIVEKPLDITLEKCDKIIQTCEENKVKLAVIFPSRFKGPALSIRKALDENRFGKLTLGDAQVKWYRSQKYYDSGGWRGTWKFDGGGALMNQSIHYIDLLQSFMGAVVEINAYTDTLVRKIEVEDTAVATIRFASGALGIIEGTTSVYPGLDSRIGVHGEKGSAIIEGESMAVWEFEEEQPEDEQILSQYKKTGSSGAKDPTKFLESKGHQLQIEDMIAAINEDRSPSVDGPEGRKAVEIILAIYKSAKEGKAVKLPL